MTDRTCRTVHLKPVTRELRQAVCLPACVSRLRAVRDEREQERASENGAPGARQATGSPARRGCGHGLGGHAEPGRTDVAEPNHRYFLVVGVTYAQYRAQAIGMTAQSTASTSGSGPGSPIAYGPDSRGSRFGWSPARPGTGRMYNPGCNILWALR